MATRFKIFITIIFVFSIVGCNNENTMKNKSSEKVKLTEELPPSKVCKSKLGILKMDLNGYSVGKKTERSELLRLLQKEDCDVIEITYELKGSYGGTIPMKVVYNKETKNLKQIYTKNNVIEDYKNVSIDGLKKFLQAGEKSFYNISKYTESTYDFNNREMTIHAVGAKPTQSKWDGSVNVVKDYILSNAKDASSIEFLEWSKVTPIGEYWVVRCKYKGKNSFGAIVTENKWFYIQNGKVAKTK